MTTTIWDIDGTIILNDLPQPDWDDPNGIHPTTGENIYGDMTEYNKHAYLNPHIFKKDLGTIHNILTGRPDTRRDLTLQTLKNIGIIPDTIRFWPSDKIYSRNACLAWKARILWLMDADYYVDDDPAYRRDLVKHLIQNKSYCQCISVAEWNKLHIAGLI